MSALTATPQVDSSGYMKVAIGGDVIRRRADVMVLRDEMGKPVATHARPELRDGEILCERLGMMPVIVTTSTQV